MKLTLKIWRQPNAESKGSMVSYEIDEISPDILLANKSALFV